MKKIHKVFIILLVILLTIWSTIFFINMNRAGNLKEPIFLKINYDINDGIAKDGGSANYHGLGYDYYVGKQLSTEYGISIIETKMTIFGKVVGASITESILEENKFFFENTNAGFKLEVPQKIHENTNVIINENEMVVYMNDGMDFVFSVSILPKEEYTEEFFKTVINNNFNDKYVVFLSFPTCGTLNNNDVRDLLEEFQQIAKEFSSEDIIKL